MKQRWYDTDPTLSMAISLLYNASKTHQEMAARYLYKFMEAKKLMDRTELRTKEERIRFLFPAFRRSGFEIHARYIVELIKHLNYEAQQDVAIALINYVYVLDSGLTDFPMPDDEPFCLAQPEIG
jgi:hypothetical protein